MSGGGLDDPPLPVPHPSPKHQPMGSPRHQAPTSQQSPLHKPTNQQGARPGQPQKSQAGAVNGGPFATSATKQPSDSKTTTPAMALVPTMDTQKQPKPTEEKPKTESENQTAKETKPTQKKGEQIKEIKKTRHYDVSQIFFFNIALVKCTLSVKLWKKDQKLILIVKCFNQCYKGWAKWLNQKDNALIEM